MLATIAPTMSAPAATIPTRATPATHVENLEQRLRQKAGPAGDLEHAEPEKGIDALAIAEIDEGALQIGALRLVERRFGGGDTIALDHHPQQLGVTGFLEPLERHRFAHQRVGDRLCIRGDDRACASLRVEHFLPKGDTAQSSECGVIEIGPSERHGVEMAAEKSFPSFALRPRRSVPRSRPMARL
jgi:hypothetical protein